jgi:hypothetical protein
MRCAHQTSTASGFCSGSRSNTSTIGRQHHLYTTTTRTRQLSLYAQPESSKPKPSVLSPKPRDPYAHMRTPPLPPRRFTSRPYAVSQVLSCAIEKAPTPGWRCEIGCLMNVNVHPVFHTFTQCNCNTKTRQDLPTRHPRHTTPPLTRPSMRQQALSRPTLHLPVFSKRISSSLVLSNTSLAIHPLQ